MKLLLKLSLNCSSRLGLVDLDPLLHVLFLNFIFSIFD